MAAKITKRINSLYNPSFVSGYPIYAGGGPIDPMTMMAQQAQGALSDIGTGLDTYINYQNPNRANVGSAFASGYLSGGMGIPGLIKGGLAALNKRQAFKAQQAQQEQLQQDALKSQMISNLPAQHYYSPTFAMGGNMPTIDRELERGQEVEMEHKPTLKFIKKYYKDHGRFPSAKKVAKSISVDHIKDYKKVNDMGRATEESYYKGLIDNNLSDEVFEYADGGVLTIPDAKLEAIRALNYGGILSSYPNGGDIRLLPSISPQIQVPINTSLVPTLNSMYDKNTRFRRNGPTFFEEANNLDNTIKSYNNSKDTRDFAKLSEARRLKEDLLKYQLNPETKKFAYGGIHIKPENRGKFTETMRRTGKSASELSHSKNPLTRKRAIFALNARKWHHEDGGELYASGGGLSRSEDYGSKKKPYPSVKPGDFAGGGRSYPIPTRADAVDALRLAGLHGRSDVRAKVYKKYPDLKKAFGGNIDNITNRLVEFRNGGTHESSIYGGIPVGPNALTEQGEFMFTTKNGKKYIFSNRF